MTLTKLAKTTISLGIIIALTAGGIPAIVIPLRNYNTITLTLLENAGVMIESKGKRIYVDPIDLMDNYTDLPADLILITHQHWDHYQESTIEMLQKEDTVNIFPEIMKNEIIIHDGIGILPEEQYTIGSITITAYYMYTFPVDENPASHPQENNYCSYIIDIGGFTIFHAGDSKNIIEYENLTGTIDVALLPLGPGCQTMSGMEVIDSLNVIEPTYFIPIHYAEGAPETLFLLYDTYLEDYEILYLPDFSSHEF